MPQRGTAAVLRWPFPWTMLSASEGCAPRAQRARAAALRLQEQAGQYGWHAAAIQCRTPPGTGYAGSRRSRGSGCVGLCAGPQGRRWRSPRSLRRAEAVTRPRAASARDPVAFASALTTMLATSPGRGMAPSDSRLVVRWCLVLSSQASWTSSKEKGGSGAHDHSRHKIFTHS